MARPTKTPQERRGNQLNTALTDAERAEIEHYARLHGLTAAEFMRRRALGYRLPAPVAAQQQTAEHATALLRIGVNLNQWTHHMNAGRIPPFDILRAILARINAMLDEIYGPGDNGGRAVL